VPGRYLGSLFAYQAPHCSFRPSEQRLLLVALRGGTNQELADDLSISLSAVKKTWLSIYNRDSNRLPSIFPNGVAIQEEGERGKEKKQHLIAYLRDHPERAVCWGVVQSVVHQAPLRFIFFRCFDQRPSR